MPRKSQSRGGPAYYSLITLLIRYETLWYECLCVDGVFNDSYDFIVFLPLFYFYLKSSTVNVVEVRCLSEAK